jgi:Tfp pilus assembly protein PilX
MKVRRPTHEGEEAADWKAAKLALAEARQLTGSQRIEALKRAGQLRYDAHKKLLREREQDLKLMDAGSNESGAPKRV